MLFHQGMLIFCCVFNSWRFLHKLKLYYSFFSLFFFCRVPSCVGNHNYPQILFLFNIWELLKRLFFGKVVSISTVWNSVFLLQKTVCYSKLKGRRKKRNVFPNYILRRTKQSRFADFNFGYATHMTHPFVCTLLEKSKWRY